MAKTYKQIAVKYAKDIISGKQIACKEVINAAQRFIDDLNNTNVIEYKSHDADVIINIIETFMIHKQGEDINGNSLVGKPLILQPWQIFIVCNLAGIIYKNSGERKYKEAFIMIPRKSITAICGIKE